MPDTRRDSLKRLVAIGAVAAAPPAFAQHTHLPDSNASDQPGYEHSPYKVPVIAPFAPQTFSAAEGAVISKVVDLIIPATDTPGALAAGVPQYIDNAAASNPARRRVIADGIRRIDAKSRSLHEKPFLELADEQQVALLTVMVDTEVFRALKDLTVDGYYGSYAGLVQELGYQGNQMLASFPGCGDEHEL